MTLSPLPDRPRQHQLKRIRTIRGFSLTEIAIAIATVSFSLAALLGLVSVSLKTGQGSEQETCLASASRQALDALRSRNFRDLPYTEPPRTANVTEPTVLPTIYLSEEGQWLSPERNKWPVATNQNSIPPEAAYQCVVHIEPDAGTLTPPTLAKLPPDATRVNLLRIKLELGTIAGSRISNGSSTSPTVLIHASLPRK